MAAVVTIVVVVDLLWGHAIYPADLQDRVAWEDSPFPRFPTNDTLSVVRVPPSTNASMLLTLVSLQGVVNRQGVRLYLDLQDELDDEGSILRYLSMTYAVSVEGISVGEALRRYLPEAKGLFLVSPDKPEAVNVGTMYASLNDWVLASPETVGVLGQEAKVPVRMKYADTGWGALSRVDVYRRALKELYPLLDPPFLAILPPERAALRDYLVAAGAFVFHFPQGALATPQDHAATLEILHGTPRGMPVLGWFESPTVTEENLFVQMASREGKALVGGYEVPNLSVLASFGRDRMFTPPAVPSQPPPLEDKVYVAIGIADGDSLDYLTIRMRELWASPVRGSLPVGWSVNPLLVDLAPAYLAYYYESASSQDSFLASPSGAGYLYPDHLRGGDLSPYLEVSRRYMAAAGLDVVWLLNGFPASEVAYSQESLAAYVEVIRPRGIVLDYDDAPVARATWIQSGGGAASPVVRSTHLWTTKANLLAKAQSALDAAGPGPRFLWMTVYPWRYGLEDAQDVVRALDARVGGDLEVVDSRQFFTLLQQDALRRAGEEVRRAQTNPLASPLLNEAEDHLQEAESLADAGEESLAAYHAFLATESLARVRLIALLLALLAVAAGASLSVLLIGRRKEATDRVRSKPPPGHVAPLLLLAAILATFLVAVRSALEANFWSYHFLLVAAVASGAAFPLAAWARRILGSRASPLLSALLPGAAALTLYTAVALPLATVAALMAASGHLRRTPQSGAWQGAAILLGMSLGLLLPVGWTTVALLGVFIVATTLLSPRPTAHSSLPLADRGSWVVGLALTLPLFALAVAHSFSLALRVGLAGDALPILGVAVLAGSALLSLAVPLKIRYASIGGLLLMAGTAALLLVSRSPVASVLLLLGMASGAALFARAGLLRFLDRGGDPMLALRGTVVTVPLFLLFLRLPPLAYSLLLPLPEALEYTLYARQAFAAGVALLLLAYVGFRRRSLGRPRAKHM